MTKDIWINLPVKNIPQSKEFFAALGFSFNPRFSKSDDTAALMVGEKNIVVMLFDEKIFRNFTSHPVTDTKLSTEVLLSIDAESKQEVDELAAKAEAAGGKLFGKPTEIQGWMYGCGFTDLDGHRWNVLYMDVSKMPPNK
jgi:predicted lactoylglutathione lyase